MSARTSKARGDLPPRPLWLSPVWPLVLLVAGVGLLFLDGLHPYRVWWRRSHWRKTEAVLLESFEKRRLHRNASRGGTDEYLARRAQKLVYETVVTRGWPIRRRKKVYQVRIHYSYFVGNTKHIKLADSPGVDFASRKAALRFVDGLLQKQKLLVWVDPSNPKLVTAFLQEPWSARWVRVGVGVAAAALIWLMVVLVVGRRLAQVEQEREKRSE